MASLKSNFVWTGDELRYGNRKHPCVRLEPDHQWPGMWRIVLPDEIRTDMLNRARAEDCAKTFLDNLLRPPKAPAAETGEGDTATAIEPA